MHSLSNITKTALSKDDSLAGYRAKMMYLCTYVWLALIVPLTVVNLFDGYILLSIATTVMIIILAFNAYAIREGTNQSIASVLFVIASIVVISIVFAERGIFGVFWTPALVLYFYFIERRHVAHLYVGSVVVYSVGLAFYYLDAGIALRFSASLLVIVFFLNIFLNLIESLQSQLVDASDRDPLTGALNRRRLDEYLNEAIDRKRRTNTPASILVFDLDHFKSINDTYGHAEGDRVLTKFVELVVAHSRRLDKLFRLGGEEFMLLLPDTPLSGATHLAVKMLSIIEKEEIIAGHRVTSSIGLGELAAGESVDEWLTRCDGAVYEAKRLGRNRFELSEANNNGHQD